MLVLAASVIAPTASATDHYPAGACFAEGDASLAKIAYNTGRVWNASTGNVYVMCPITSHFSSTDPDTYMGYVDNSSSQNVTCTHAWMGWDGAQVWSWTFTSSGASSAQTGFQVNDSSHIFWFKNWRCTLPGSSSVYLTGYDYWGDQN
jgi:hypothetical protein